MTESSGSFKKLRPSKSMSLLPPSNIDIQTINQIGNYILGEELGSGAFGKVVLGKHIITGETVAIKILDKIMLKKTPEDYELVKKEMSILKLVKHRYIIQLYEILQTPNYIFIVMEYCEGKDFMDYILSKSFLSESEALKYFQELINALFYLHSQNIAHRDIKIDNILLDQNKDLKLIDFGLSTKYQENKLLDQPCGTIVYSAPEVLEGKLYHGMLADVWSCGIVLYGMLCGYLPFSEDDDNINKKNILEGNYDIPDNISIGAKNLLKHMLDINPITRYTLQEIKDHPWFKMNNFCLIQGIIIGYHKIPVDEDILDLCEKYNFDKNKIKNSVINNKFDEGSALYYLLVKQRTKNGIDSESDLFSDKFIKYIYNEDNLIHSFKTKNNYLKHDIKERMRKTKSNLSANPGLILGKISTPKKIKNIRILINGKNDEKEINAKQSTDINKIMKRNKKIKLFSSINKKSISKIQKSNNIVTSFFDEKNYISNTSNLCLNKKFKNKITQKKTSQKNKDNNNENHKIINKINHNSKYNDNHSPFIQTEFIIDNIHRTIKQCKKKTNKSINLQLSNKEIINNKTSEKHQEITSHSQITKKSKNKIGQNSNKIYAKINKISSLKQNGNNMKNEKNRNNLIKSNYKVDFKLIGDFSTITMEKISKSIDTIETCFEIKSKNQSNDKLNNRLLEENKDRKQLIKKSIKNTTPINKLLKNRINYLSNYISTINSKEKRNIQSLKKPQIRIDRNEGYSTNYTNYTKSSSHSSNAINKNKKHISTNAFNLSRISRVNNFNIYRKPSNLKNNSNMKIENICTLIKNKIDKNKINKSMNIFAQYVNANNRPNYNNIKLIKINKLEKLKKSSKNLYINNKLFKEGRNINKFKNSKQAKTLYDKQNKDNSYSNMAPSLTKYKNRINFSTNNEKGKNTKEIIGIKNAENISIIKVNQKSKSRGKNLTSPNKYKIKQKINNNYNINYNNKIITKKRYFESSVITRRYKSPIILRQLSESQNKKKYLNKNIKNKQINISSISKGKNGKIGDKKIKNKINKNPLILSNIQIKSKAKIHKNKTPLKIITNINIGNARKFLSKKTVNNINKTNNNLNNNKTQINPRFSKDNIYYAPNLLYKLNSPKNQINKHNYHQMIKNNHSINFLEAKQYPLLQTIKNKCTNNSNKKIYHRNLNHFNISKTTNTNLTNNNHFSNNSISTSLSMNSIAVIKDKSNINNMIINPGVLDLSCIIIDKKNLNECNSFLINKFKNSGCYFKQISMNVFDCFKNEDHCQIEIMQLLSDDNIYNINNQIVIDENGNNPIFYFKIIKKKGSYNFLRALSKIIFSYN